MSIVSEVESFGAGQGRPPGTEQRSSWEQTRNICFHAQRNRVGARPLFLNSISPSRSDRPGAASNWFRWVWVPSGLRLCLRPKPQMVLDSVPYYRV